VETFVVILALKMAWPLFLYCVFSHLIVFCVGHDQVIVKVDEELGHERSCSETKSHLMVRDHVISCLLVFLYLGVHRA